MPLVRPRIAGLACALALALGCGGGGPSAQGAEDDYTVGDFPVDQVLPYAGAWLDAPKALAGVGQFDRLRGTIYDDAKCSTMVAIAAAIVGGEQRFVRLLDVVADKREGRPDDLAVVARVREATARRALTARHLLELTEAMVRAWKVGNGAYDEQIADMIRASGYVAVRVGSTRPSVLVDRLADREIVPLSIVAEGIPHITLLWKDARGVVRLYDSDDVGGSHVMPRGSTRYRARVDAEDSAWDLAEKYR